MVLSMQSIRSHLVIVLPGQSVNSVPKISAVKFTYLENHRRRPRALLLVLAEVHPVTRLRRVGLDPNHRKPASTPDVHHVQTGGTTYRLRTPDCPGARRTLGKLKTARRTSAVIWAIVPESE